MELSRKTELLFEWVKEQHGDQVRKYTGEPYWQHLLNVADTVSTANNSVWTICVALCHDLIEDTDCSMDMLKAKLKELGFSRLGIRFICSGVYRLTDYFTKERFPELNRSERKVLEARRLSGIEYFYQTIKYADLIDNTSSIVSHDPKFAEVYLAEKRFILSGMRAGNKELLEQCEKLVGL